jgi:DNA polymerase-4
MSILYCAIPYFAATLARRDDASLRASPLVLIGPQRQVFAVSPEAAAYGIVAGLTIRDAEARCPQARLVEADVARCREEFETLLQILELCSPAVEPHGWGAAYADLGDLARNRAQAVTLCSDIGTAARKEMGEILQPALGWNSSKFTAQAAARHTRPGHLLPITAVKESAFLRPLPVQHLPLDADAHRRLVLLGLRTLGQYAELPVAAVWQQFGRAGKMAQRCARGEDDRPVIPRSHEQRLSADYLLEVPLSEQERLLAVLQQVVSPLLGELRSQLQSCGRVRLTVRFADHTTQEQERSLLFPTAAEARVMLILKQLLDLMHWSAEAEALEVTLEHIQDAVVEQLSLFPAENERERKLQEVQQALEARLGARRLLRAMLTHPGAPLPEWRVGWAYQ